MIKRLELFYLPGLKKRYLPDLPPRIVAVDFNAKIKGKDVVFHKQGGVGWATQGSYSCKASYSCSDNPYIDKAAKIWGDCSLLNDWYCELSTHRMSDNTNYNGQGVVIASNPEILDRNKFYPEKKYWNNLHNDTALLPTPKNKEKKPIAVIIECYENGKPKIVKNGVAVKRWIYRSVV